VAGRWPATHRRVGRAATWTDGQPVARDRTLRSRDATTSTASTARHKRAPGPADPPRAGACEGQAGHVHRGQVPDLHRDQRRRDEDKSLNITCIRNGQQSGGNLITKSLKITDGKFTFDGKSTLRSSTNSVIKVKVTGKFVDGKITGKVTYLDAPAPCTTRSYSAKYYGVNPQG
jgi:hypothetical protein